MSKVWFTSDLHIGHELVAKERTRGWILPRYVGAEVDAHDRTIARNWDRVVNDTDVVIVAGDISSGTKHAQIAALDWIAERPGRKVLVSGNHDKVHPMHRDALEWAGEYWLVFEHVTSAMRRRIPLSPQGHADALVSHFPYTGDHTDPDRHAQWRLKDLGLPIIHGHTHSSKQLSYALGTGTLQLHVGLDAHNLELVPLEWITEKIQSWMEMYA